MRVQSVRLPLAVVALIALPSFAAAQFPPPPSGPPVQSRWPDPRQRDPEPPPPETQSPAPRTPARRPPPPPRAAAPVGDETLPPAAAPAKPTPKPKPAAAPTNLVACNGVFAKDSTHQKLAIKYDLRNIVFTDVDGQDGSKMKASVLFPNDPKRRLEVLWQNETTRAATSLIVITGQSTWVAPKGLKIGLPLAAIEKANGKPFKLSGLGADGLASVTGWESGAMAALPGGCKVGIRLAADSGAPPAARAVAASDRSFLSNEAALRSLKLAIAEILIGY